jgi:hypothetical protein
MMGLFSIAQIEDSGPTPALRKGDAVAVALASEFVETDVGRLSGVQRTRYASDGRA